MEREFDQVQNSRKITVKIFNEDYVVKGNDDEDYIKTLAAYVDRRMKMLSQRNPSLSMTRVAVLTALNMADELNSLQNEFDELTRTLEAERKERQG